MLGILAIAHHDDAAHHFSLAVELGQTAPALGPGDHIRHVTQQQRGAAHIGTERDLLQILDALEIAVERTMYSASAISMTEAPVS